MKKMTDEEKKVSISIVFDRDIIKAAEAEAVNGRISRSAWVNIAVEKVLKMESKKAGAA